MLFILKPETLLTLFNRTLVVAFTSEPGRGFLHGRSFFPDFVIALFPQYCLHGRRAGPAAPPCCPGQPQARTPQGRPPLPLAPHPFGRGD